MQVASYAFSTLVIQPNIVESQRAVLCLNKQFTNQIYLTNIGGWIVKSVLSLGFDTQVVFIVTPTDFRGGGVKFQ